MRSRVLDLNGINLCRHMIPYIRYSNEDKYENPWMLKERKISDHEFILVTKGSGVFYIEDRMYHVKPDHLLLIYPDIIHSGKSIELPFHFFCIHFDIYVSYTNNVHLIDGRYVNEPVPTKPIKYVKANLSLNEHVILKNTGYINLLFKRIIYELKEKPIASGLAIKAHFTDLIVNMIREQQISESKKLSMEVQTIIDYIKNNYMNNITLNELASLVHLHPSYISNIFKKQTGITLSGFITMQRISAAKKLLLETDRKIEDIAGATGFYDVHHLSNRFKKIEGLSPSQYRSIRR